MNRSWIIATREYRALTRTRAFWISIVLVPVGLFLAGFLPAMMLAPPGTAYTVLDRSGHYAQAIEQRIEWDYQKQVLRGLIGYVQRLGLHPKTVPAPWDSADPSIGDREVMAFLNAGGADAVLAEIQPLLRPDTPAFRSPFRSQFAVPLPVAVPDDAGGDAVAALLRPSLDQKVATPIGPRPLSIALYIPAHPDPKDQPILLLTNGRADGGLIATIRAELTIDLKRDAVAAAGLDAATLARIEAVEAPILKLPPPAEANKDPIGVRVLLPVALALLLLITVMTAGGMMLQGMIEERSNKLLEALLACVSAHELMRGKLLGVGTAGLTIAAVWLGCAIAGSLVLPHDLMVALRPALGVLESPWLVLSLMFYFVTGYMITAMIFLAVGAMTDSAQEAQGYLMPIIMLLTVPVAGVLGGVIQNPDGAIPQVMSWIPLYTPFVMLARLGTGVGPADILGTSALLILFVYAEFTLLGRVFRANLLRTGQPPRLGAILRLMVARDL